MATTAETVRDPQTGKEFELSPEDRLDVAAATCAALYLLVTLAFLGWLLLDTWADRNLIVEAIGYEDSVTSSDTYRLFIYVAIAGALGGAIAGIRSIIYWHAENRAYGWRFIWKDVARPWVGAALGTLIYVSVRGGVGVIDGDFSLDGTSGIALFSAFSLSAVIGFGSPQVYKWIDDKANKFLSVKPGDSTADDEEETQEAPL